MDANQTDPMEANATAHAQSPVEQPEPFTPGLTKAMVRQHAFELYRDRLTRESLTIQDWVLAEKDLADSLDTDNVPK